MNPLKVMHATCEVFLEHEQDISSVQNKGVSF
jgi:hypothetical protein